MAVVALALGNGGDEGGSPYLGVSLQREDARRRLAWTPNGDHRSHILTSMLGVPVLALAPEDCEVLRPLRADLVTSVVLALVHGGNEATGVGPFRPAAGYGRRGP